VQPFKLNIWLLQVDVVVVAVDEAVVEVSTDLSCVIKGCIKCCIQPSPETRVSQTAEV